MAFFFRFKRITSSGQYLPSIDCLRFIAIAAVIFTHIFRFIEVKQHVTVDNINSLIWTPVVNGGQGVQLFFAISGFILALPFISNYTGISNKNVSLKAYFLRRLTRLEPPYIISMIFFFCVLIIIKKEEVIELIPHLIASLFYLHNLIYGKGSDINTVAWSLEVEVQFYIIAPLIFLLFKKSKSIRRQSICLSIITFAILNSSFEIYYRTLIGQAQYFLIGVLAADIFLTEDKKLLEKLNNPAIFISSLSVIFFVNYKDGFFQLILFLFAILILLLCSIKSDPKNAFLKSKIFSLIGGMCYSIYLIHYPLLSLIGNFLIERWPISSFGNSFILYSMVIIPVIIMTSFIFYIFFERPFMNKNWYKIK
jgi:peptidoglycan/LPS O-acetylase OafA/YrhL